MRSRRLQLKRARWDAAVADRSNAHLAVWKISGGGRAGTAFAVSDKHFVTCAHVLKSFVDRGIEDMFLSQESNQSPLRMNHSHAAIAPAYDLAVFTTAKEVSYALRIASSLSPDRNAGLRMIAYPEGSFAVIDQVENLAYSDRLTHTIPMDRVMSYGQKLVTG